jgi:hypothetical protein
MTADSSQRQGYHDERRIDSFVVLSPFDFAQGKLREESRIGLIVSG